MLDVPNSPIDAAGLKPTVRKRHGGEVKCERQHSTPLNCWSHDKRADGLRNRLAVYARWGKHTDLTGEACTHVCKDRLDGAPANLSHPSVTMKVH